MDSKLKNKIKLFADSQWIATPSDFAGWNAPTWWLEWDLAYREAQMKELESKPWYDIKTLLEILIKKL